MYISKDVFNVFENEGSWTCMIPTVSKWFVDYKDTLQDGIYNGSLF